MSTSSLNFSREVQKLLEEYAEESVEAVTEAVDETRKAAVKRLRAVSRDTFGAGDYSKGWTSAIEKDRLGASAVVYGKTPTSSLAHLLEHGHVSRNGTGRTFGRVPAYPHIEEINEWAQEDVIRRVEEKLGG